MAITFDLDGHPDAVLLTPLWQIQRTFNLGWLEASLVGQSATSDGAFTPLEVDLVVQMWSRRTVDDLFAPVAETIIPAGLGRAIAAQTIEGFGFVDCVRIPGGSQVAVVHNAGGISWGEDPPNLTVTPHGTFA